MAQLTTVSKRTIVDSIEIVADDTSAVLMVSHSNKITTFQLRQPHQQPWAASGPTFTVQTEDATLLSAIVGGTDLSWRVSKLEAIPSARFTAPDPNPPEDLAEKARCSELDIERAKAANITEQRELLREELRLDHSRDKHITADVAGCPSCESKVRTLYDALNEPVDIRDVPVSDDDSLPF